MFTFKPEFTLTPLIQSSKSQSDVEIQNLFCSRRKIIGSQTIPPSAFKRRAYLH